MSCSAARQIDTSALPVKHPSRTRGPDSWTGPNGLYARFGRDAAHGEWFYGFRLAARTDLGSRLVRAWGIVPAAVNERDVVPGLIEGADGLVGLLTDKGFNGKAFAASVADARGPSSHLDLGPAPTSGGRTRALDRFAAGRRGVPNRMTSGGDGDRVAWRDGLRDPVRR